MTTIRAPGRDPKTIRRELAEAETRLAELRCDPRFLLCGGDIEIEHRWTARRLAVLRSELAGASDGRPPLAQQRY